MTALLEWKTIHIGTHTTVLVQGVPCLEVIVAPGPDLNTGAEDEEVGYSPSTFETSIAQERQQAASLNANTTVVSLCMLVIMPPMRMAK